MIRRKGTTAEPLLNRELAEQLRRVGLQAQAEQILHDHRGRRHQVDILIELDDDAIAIEAEFAPARTVRSDAKKRLPERPLYWGGVPVTSVLTLIYPRLLQKIPESDAPEALAQCGELIFAQGIREDHEAAQQQDLFKTQEEETLWRSPQTGGPQALAELLHDFWIRTAQGAGIERTVTRASEAIATAAEILGRAPGMQADEESDPASTRALIWLNALLFQELLAKDLDPSALPPPHTKSRIPRPQPDLRPSQVLRQWKDILRINWWPIFHIARQTLADTPSPMDVEALGVLMPCAREMAEDRVVRRHDVAGRIFHRLLDTRKFLATNYTTIPGAVLLAGLAFDEESASWKKMDWTSQENIGGMRIVDPACGSGTLLMATLQEILKRWRRTEADEGKRGEVIKQVLEQVILGFDVVPGAIHLSAVTLSMAETRQVLKDLPLYLMHHDREENVERLGSLDFLKRAPNHSRVRERSLFASAGSDPGRTTGEGKQRHDICFPPDCKLIICNPPYTRAGGPGSAEHTDWNPVFGSMLSEKDAKKMQAALRKTLNGTPASLYAGLGSAFLTLADEHLGVDGRLAFVLPATGLTGSRWENIRQMLLTHYDVEWIVTSHDPRTRAKKAGLPGRNWVGFSESTRLAETLIVATKRNKGTKSKGFTRFVNLRRNPDEAIEAMGIARALLARRKQDMQTQGRMHAETVDTADEQWGEIIAIPQRTLEGQRWAYATFIQSGLTEAALNLRDNGILGKSVIQLQSLEHDWITGPAEMQIKNKKQGLFKIRETSDPTALGHPALWHHKGKHIHTLRAKSNARLRERRDRDEVKQQEMLDQGGRIQLARELRHAAQRVAAVCTEEPMLGVRSWISLKARKPRSGVEETLCLWLNSTPGLILRLIHANRPYLGRTSLPHELAQTLPLLDVSALSAKQLKAAKSLFADLESRSLKGIAELAKDETRRDLDRRLLTDVLYIHEVSEVERVAEALAREPVITVRH